MGGLGLLIREFDDDLAFSVRAGNDVDCEIIQRVHPDCVSVRKTETREEERAGIDYVAVLKGGHAVRWDAKRRKTGCSSYWKKMTDGRIIPELALETWSVIPEPPGAGAIGWTLDEYKKTDYILFTFDASDYAWAYAVPFQHLRAVFTANKSSWRSQYRHGTQTSRCNGRKWQSECVFVPAPTLLRAIAEHCVRKGGVSSVSA